MYERNGRSLWVVLPSIRGNGATTGALRKAPLTSAEAHQHLAKDTQNLRDGKCRGAVL